MTEEFLHYIWRYRLYDTQLFLTTGEIVEIIHPGELNTDSGPDFFNARIKIGNTLWAGNIEIHVNSSDWYRHNHHVDHAYDNLILHVVYNHDKVIPWLNHSELPTLELNQVVRKETWQRYLKFMASHTWIPCENLVAGVSHVSVSAWLDRLLVERLEKKSKQVEQALTSVANDWNHAFYLLLARNMGFKLNNDAFERLAASISYRVLFRHADNLIQVEAMLFGQAGMLDQEFMDDYPRRLKFEYDFLKKKYQLKAIENHCWKYLRLHPGNFPTIRISQLANLIHVSGELLKQLFDLKDIEGISSLFNIQASAYWFNHYRFDKFSVPASKRLGEESIKLLTINLISPFLFTYGQKQGNSEHMEIAMKILEKTTGENNSVVRKWISLGIDASTAAHTQALLELKSNYCDRKKCLSCTIGSALLKARSE
jgi:hypothetical protein